MGERNESSTDSAEIAAVDSQRNRLEATFRQIVESIPVPVAVTTPTGDVETLNKPTLEYFGKTLEELKGWKASEVVHPDDLQRTVSAQLEAHQKGVAYDVESRHLRADGTYRWFNVHGLPLRDTEGNILRWFHLLVDIDDRKKAEEIVRASELDLTEVINTIPAMAWSARPDGSANFFNQHYLDYLGLSAEQAKDSGWTIAVHPDDLDNLFLTWNEIMSSEKPGEAEARLRRHDGAYRWFLFRANPLRDEDGKVVKWYGANTDIQDLKQAETELVRAYDSFADAQQLSKTGSFITDLMSDDHNWSEEAYRIFEFEPGTNVTVQRIRDIIHAEDLPSFDSVIERAMAGGNVNFEFRIVTDRGEIKRIDGVAHVIEQVEGRPLFVGALRDVTESWAAEDALRERERQFKTIFDEAGTGITLVDLKIGEPIRNNRALQKMLGCSEENLSRFETYDRLSHPDNREKDSATFRELCEGKIDSLSIEKHFIVNDGRSIWANVIFTLLRGDDGQPRYIIGIHEDITERKLTLERLQANQNLLNLAQKAARATAFDWYVQEKVNKWSPEQEALYGLEPGTFDGTFESWKTLVHPVDWPLVIDAIEEAHETGDITAEYRTIWPDGTVHWLAAKGQMFFDEAGEPLRMVGFTSDVSQRKTVEVQLAGEKRLLEMVATGGSLIEILRALCTFVEEIAPECRCGVNLIEWSEPKFQLPVAVTLPATYNGQIEGLPVRPDVGPCAMAVSFGTQVIVEDIKSDPRWRGSAYRELALAHELISCWSTPIFSLSGRVLGSFAIYQGRPAKPTPLQQDLIGQVTHIASIAIERARQEEDLRRSEAELRRANQYLTVAQELSKTGSYAWDVIVDEQNLSDEMYRIWEIDPADRVTRDVVMGRIHPDDLAAFEGAVDAALEAGEDIVVAYRIVTGSGAVKHLRTVSRRLAEITDRLVYVGATQDVTGQKLAEEALDHARSELAHVSRVTTLGALTASIAHEVNQPLSGIITNASTCRRMLTAESPNIAGALETANRIVRDGNRASEVITRLRSLFRKREVTGESINLNDAAEEVITLSQRELQANQILVKQELSDDLPIVIGDRVQLQQVILNLLLNASHAMAGINDRPRELLIRTQRDTEDRVLLSVKDTGVGFDPQNKEKLFDAFYTTKKSGMGIGLHVSRSIIESHNGRLWAAKNDGPGATFLFSIPRAA